MFTISKTNHLEMYKKVSLVALKKSLKLFALSCILEITVFTVSSVILLGSDANDIKENMAIFAIGDLKSSLNHLV